MLEIALHAGTEHPNLAYILIPSILTFIAGLAIGHYSDRVSAWIDLMSSTRD